MSFAVQAKVITVTRLTGEMREGRVTTSDTPRLGWQMSSPENGTRQTAYEIEVRDVWAGKVVWNSGKVYDTVTSFSFYIMKILYDLFSNSQHLIFVE